MHFKLPMKINELGFSLTNSFCTNEEYVGYGPEAIPS